MKLKLKGLTLVELLIAISISLILVVASIPLIISSTGKEALQDQAQITASFVERARNYALHPESEFAQSYKVRFLTKNQLEIERGVPDEDGTIGYTGTGEVLNLPTNFEIVESYVAPVFNVPTGSASAGSIQIHKTGSNGGDILISIESPGVINVGEIF